MTQGYYLHRGKVYFGEYDERQVSGAMSAAAIKPEDMMTDRVMSQTDRAVRFYDNHALLEAEYEDIESALAKMRMLMPFENSVQTDFSAFERRLGTALPAELRLIYSAIGSSAIFFDGSEHFLPPDEIYADSGVIVFYRTSRTSVVGYDTASGRLAGYSRKQWVSDPGDICVYQFCLARMFYAAIGHKPVTKQGRGRGKFVTTLNIEKELLPLCGEKYHLLSELNIYGIAVMYSADGTIAWIRSNGSFADIHAGAQRESDLDMLCAHLGGFELK